MLIMSKSRFKDFFGSYSFLRGNVGVLMLCRFIWSISRMAQTYLSLFVLNLGGSNVTLGLMNSLGSVAQFIMLPIGGYLADSVSDRIKVIGIGTTCLALSYLIYMLAPNATMILIGAFIINLCFFHSPSQSALMAASLRPVQRSLGYAFIQAVERGTPMIIAVFGGILLEIYGIDLGYNFQGSLAYYKSV